MGIDFHRDLYLMGARQSEADDYQECEEDADAVDEFLHAD